MNYKQVSLVSLALAVIAMVAVLSIPLAAQTITTGDLVGVVTDPSGAVLPNATVTLKNTQTGATQAQTTNTQGVYRFALLPPATYTITVAAPGFQTSQRTASVGIGVATTANVQMALSSASQTVEVTAEAGVVQTENGNVATTFSSEQIANIPNPGNDLSYIVQTAPGAVMNTQAGYGNSAVFGLPATSNLYTENGMNENDPFLNLNNSGATNLLLGQNDVQQATVVNNGYTGQYGQLAGANVNYVTKAGSNAWHGNLNYFWNGRIMNANSYFNNQSGVARPFDNANQWAASLGGPIVKDKTFFFVNTEGLRVLLPTTTKVRIPSPQFETATLNNISANSPASLPFYTNMFNLWKNAPGATRAQDVLPPGDSGGGGCGTGQSAFTQLGPGVPCALQFQATPHNLTHEWLLTARVDQNIGNSDRAFLHFRSDHGLQATYTDPINSIFNAQSDQPQYEGQFNESHTFGNNAVNQFILSGSWYSAIFKPKDLPAALGLMPFRLAFSGNSFFSLGRLLNDWPQGRNVTQYQIVDDYSVQKGSHAIKFGVNFHRNDVSDWDPGIGSIGYSQTEDLTDFFNGVSTTYTQSFPTRLREPVALYGLGLYLQDEWAATRNLKLTLALRADHNSNPVCQTNCFARLTSSFEALNHDPGLPYNQAIRTGIHQALPNFTKISWQPRLGFAWTPRAGGNTVLRGGVGFFADSFPATVADNFMINPPLDNTFVVTGLPLSPDAANNAASSAASASAAFTSAFNSGGTLASIATNPANAFFTPPAFYNAAHMIHAPLYEEWNLQFQQGIGQKMSFSLNYVGNHGIYEAIQNGGLNAYCNATPLPFFASVTPCLSSLGATSFAGLPLMPSDQRFGTVTQVSSAGVSNYNGLTASFTRRFSALQLQANYTWSHAIDEISNAGFLQYNFATNTSILNPQDPFNLRKYNYGNADYDVRHNLSLNYVYSTPNWGGIKGVLGNWTISGTLYDRTGLPLTVSDSAATGTLNGFNYGTNAGNNIFANYLGGARPGCTRAAVAPANGPGTPCLTTAEFSPAISGFGNQRRNQFFGPRYFDTDLTVMKNFKIPGWESAKLGLGVQFFNLLNHVNFDQPIADVQDSQFGQIVSTVNTPTSILGSFLGGDASPRLIQLKGTLTF
jgi:hypothetical protein